jgi:[acyl-carrier-protein] S-malonyltransferase
MKDAEDEYKDVLAGYKFNDPAKKVFSNVTGEEVKSGEEAKQLCSQQLVSGVLWVKEEKALLDLGIEKCLEVGPGAVLGGLWKAVSGDLKCQPAGTLENITNI